MAEEFWNGYRRVPSDSTQIMVEADGYIIPGVFTLYSLELCERELPIYQKWAASDWGNPAVRDHYIPWLEKRIKEFKLKELIIGEQHELTEKAPF